LTTAAGGIVFVVVAFIVTIRIVFWDQALPGVQAARQDLAGLSRPEIEVPLGNQLNYPQAGLIVLRDGEKQWLARPEQLGAVIDVPGMAERALAVGRHDDILTRINDQLEAWDGGRTIPTLVLFDQRTGSRYLYTIGGQIDQPTLEAQLTLEGTSVRSTPGQVGRKLNVPATLEMLTPAIWLMHDAQIDLVIEEEHPIVLDATPDAERARRILSTPLALTAEGEIVGELTPERLATMLWFRPLEAESRYLFALDEGQLRLFLEPLAPELERDPENARFIFNDDTRQLDLHKPAVIGRRLDIEGSLRSIQEAVDADSSQAELAFDFSEPDVTSAATAEELGISENVAAVSTYFSGSGGSRRQNIATASEAFHGLLLAPGETLSMAEVLGDISLDKGYAEALIIFGDRTIKGVGGGVCQVSTTLFRAAFFGGYQIDERYPHAYRVLYYEQGRNSPGPGLDATVFVPMVDFKFTNDSPYWLLLETYIYGDQLLWKFYSTSDGRNVEWSSGGPKDVEEAPEPLYRENPDLDEGKIEQVDFEADGMDVTVTRSVTREGQTIHDDVFRTHYLPWQAIYEYGPGTDLPEDAETE
jgi:vancomycin resistance protein YoaR